MDNKNTTIVICCAGMGTRLGIGSTKALVDIDGIPLILYILKLLDNYDDVRIVVGYQAEKVIEVVNSYRKDIMFVFNYNFQNTTIVDSLKKASLYPREYIVEIDGDLLIKEEDFEKFMNFEGECIGYNNISSEDPIYLEMKNKQVTNISKEKNEYEWTGLAKIKSKKIKHTKEYVYELIQPLLPLCGIKVDAIDIDTPDDYEKALIWLNERRAGNTNYVFERT